jgi:hypothetical protein
VAGDSGGVRIRHRMFSADMHTGPPPPPYRSPYASPYRTPSHPPLQVLPVLVSALNSTCRVERTARRPRTNRTRRVPHPVLIGHAASTGRWSRGPEPANREYSRVSGREKSRRGAEGGGPRLTAPAASRAQDLSPTWRRCCVHSAWRCVQPPLEPFQSLESRFRAARNGSELRDGAVRVEGRGVSD